MSNRVEDLERQVAELQAAVNGLTEELVEMKERVRQLEDSQDVPVETNAQPAAGPVSTDESSASAESASAESAQSSQGADDSGERTTHSDDHADVVEKTDDDQDVIVPEQETTTPDAEAAKGEEQGEGSEDGESGDSDIIVA